MAETPQQTERPEWREERLRYQILRSVYDQTGGDCAHTVSATQLLRAQPVRYEDLFQAVHFLAERGYLFLMGEGLLVCVTPKGVRYIERSAGRRQSLRLSASA